MNMKTDGTVGHPGAAERGNRGRQGLGLVEVAVVVALGTMILGCGFRVLGATRRSEQRVDRDAELVELLSRLEATLGRDLARLEFVPGEHPMTARSWAAGEAELAFEVAGGADGSVTVSYRFDPGSGTLARTCEGQEDLFDLGDGSTVRFVKVDPWFSTGRPTGGGDYGNRLVYRITACRGAGAAIRTMTLVSEAPFRVKASRETFPYWNRS